MLFDLIVYVIQNSYVNLFQKSALFLKTSHKIQLFKIIAWYLLLEDFSDK